MQFKLFGADFENEGQIMGKKIGINEDTPFPEAVKQAYEVNTCYVHFNPSTEGYNNVVSSVCMHWVDIC